MIDFQEISGRERFAGDKPAVTGRFFLKLYREAQKREEEDVLSYSLSSGLSGTVNAANLAKQISEYDRVHCRFKQRLLHSVSCAA